MDKTPFSLSVSPAPHLRTPDGADAFYFDLLISLIPPVLMALLGYGQRAIFLLLLGAASAWAYNAILGLITHTSRMNDLSAPVTGFLFAMLMPVSAPVWMFLLGSFIAIVVVRELAGGQGRAIFDPAAAAVVFMLLVFPNIFSDIPAPRSSLDWFGNTPYFHAVNTSGTWAMFIGKYPGCIGTFSPVAVLTGGIYLALRRASFKSVTPAFILAAALGAEIYFGKSSIFPQLFSGTLMFSAVYLANGFTSAPVTVTGGIIYGIGAGFLTVLIRNLGYYADGTLFALLIMNALSWYIDLKAAPYIIRLSAPVRSILKRKSRGKERNAG